MKKRILSAFLLVVMLISLFPVQAFAAETTEDNSGVLTDIENNEANPSEDELPGEEVDILPLPEEEYEDAIEEPSGEPEAELTEISETPDETKDETEGETENAEELAEKVSVRFNLTPADLTLNVYSADDAQAILPEADGSYLLIPGEYYYDAECEGYVPALGVAFTVVEDAAIDVVLEADSVDSSCSIASEWWDSYLLTLDSEGTFEASWWDNYLLWSQFNSAYQKMIDAGCWIVAQSKLLMQTGVAPASGFNPDVYASWEVDNGYLDVAENKLMQTNKGGVGYAPIAYARERGNSSLTLVGWDEYYDDTAAKEKIWDNLRNGYYTIVSTYIYTASGGYYHYFYIDNSSTPGGEIYLWDSAFDYTFTRHVSITERNYTNLRRVITYRLGTPVSSVSLSPSEASMSVGEIVQLSATVSPDNAENKTISWSSSNTAVALVSSSGVVAATGIGTAVITASASDGSGVSASAAITVQGTSGACGDNLTWTLDSDGTLTISGTGDMVDFSSSSDIPWNAYIESINNIVIESGVTSIGNKALYNCQSLKTLKIPDSVTSITSPTEYGNGAIFYCGSLTNIEVDPANKNYSSVDGVLFNKTATELIHFPEGRDGDYSIPDGVTSIGAYAFNECKKIANVTIPDSVTVIDNFAFHNCIRLTSVTIPDSVTSIGSNAFSNDSGLTNMTIPDSVTSIGEYAFAGCSKLANVVIGNGVTSIGNRAFHQCGSLTSITIPDSVTSIGEYAFYNCSKLANAVIGSNVTSIGKSAFGGCSSLTSIAIPDGVTSIGSSAFIRCDSLTNVTIGNGVTTVGKSAFSNCTRLTSVTIGNSVTCIDIGAFFYCSSLTGITIPDSVTGIGENAFAGCKNLSDVYYTGTGDQWENIELGEGNDPLSNAALHCEIKTQSGSFGENFTWSLNTEGVLTITGTGLMSDFELSGEGDAAVSSAPWADKKDRITSVVIAGGVNSIGAYAFYDCGNLKCITIPDTVCTIGESAFKNCAVLTDVYYDGALSQWGYISKFSGNDALLSATAHAGYMIAYDANGGESAPKEQIKNPGEATTLSETVPTRENYKFLGWKAYTRAGEVIYQPGDAYTVDEDIYLIAMWRVSSGKCGDNVSFTLDDSGLLTITGSGVMYDYKTAASPWSDSGEYITAITVGEGVTSIGAAAFASLGNLKSVSLPSSLEKIGDYAIAACTSLTKLTIPENVSEIGIWAFTGLWSLKELNIPGSIEKISDYAFAGCNALEKLTINSGTKEIGKYAFTGCTSLTELTLPDGLETVDECAFKDCEVISTLTLPASIESIGVSAFNNCGIKSVYFLGTQAQWDAVTKGENNESLGKIYTSNLITYTSNGGGGAPEQQIKQYGKAIKLSTVVPLREHYTFLGWSTNPKATSAQYKSGASYTKNADITLYAVWKQILITKITVTPATSTLTGSNRTLELGYTTLPETADDAVTWKSSNEKIAVVNENGVVTTTGTAYGTVTITATAKDSGKKSGKCTLTVKSPLIETLTLKDCDGIEYNDSEITLPYISGSTYQYIAEKAPADSASKISWKSSSTKVATVNASGLLTVKGIGTATITAKSADTNGASASFTVNVVNYTPTLSAKSVKINSFFNSGANISVTCAENSALMSLELYTKVRSAYVPLEKIEVEDMGEDGYCLKAVEAKKASYSAYAKVTVYCDDVGEVDYYLPLRIAVVNTAPTVKITLEKINPFYVDRAWNVTVTVTNGELDYYELKDSENDILTLDSDNKLVLTDEAKETIRDNNKAKLKSGALEFIVHFKDTDNTKIVSVKPSIAVSTPKFTARDVSTGKTLSYVTFNRYFNADTAEFELYDSSSKSVVIPQNCEISDFSDVFSANCDSSITLTCNDYDAKKSKATLAFSSDEWLSPVKIAVSVKYAAAPKMTLSASGKIDLIDRENTGITYTPRITNASGSSVTDMWLDSVTDYNKEDASDAFDFSYDSYTGKATLRANDGYALLKKAYTVKISATLELNGETCDVSATVKVTPTQSTLKLKASAVKMKQGETIEVAVSTTPAACELESATVTVPAKASGLTAEIDKETKRLTISADSDIKPGTYTITVAAKPKNAVSGTAAAKLSLKVTVTK